MATVSVTTMQAFIDAVEHIESDTVIEILNDIDYNDVLNERDEPIRFNKNSSVMVGNIEINGNGHAIKNLDNRFIRSYGSYGTPIIDMVYVGNLTFNNVQFLNVNVTSGLIAAMSHVENILIKNSVIQGRFKDAIMKGSVITVRDSMITISSGSSGKLGTYSGYNPKWLGCWIDIKRCEYIPDGTYYFWTNLQTCYIQGLIPTQTHSNTKYFANSKDCVFNVRTGDLDNVGSLSNFCSGTDDDYPNIVNVTKNPYLEEYESTARVKLVTDAQMKDAEYLASIGFDIIP
jgi:hypothetical protein